MPAIIFDFDGTILDTESTEFAAWQAIYARFGQQLEPLLWGRGVGTWNGFDPLAHLESRVGHALNPAQRQALQAEQHADNLARIAEQPILPGVRELIALAEAKGWPLAIASSSDQTWVEGHLARLGLRDHFAVLKTRYDVAAVKPDPALYLAALTALGVAPAEALAIEDSPNGAKAALAAGLRVLVVPNPVTRLLAWPAGIERLENLLEAVALLATA
jgi:HAD superfamily hydrolase (TIGR01509 family)